MKTFLTFFSIAFLVLFSLYSCKKDTGGGFVQLYPANASTNIPGVQTFGCSAVEGAVTYTFSFTDASGTFSRASALDTITIQNLLPCDNYTWSVSAARSDGSSISTNPSWSFTTSGGGIIPCLQAPTNNDSNICPNTMFSWTAIAGSNSYNLQVATDAAFFNVVVSKNVTNNYYTLPAATLSAGTKYYWQITPLGASSYSSAVYNFQTVPSPQLSYPLNNADSVSRTVILSWSSNLCATSYTIDISSVNDLSYIILTQQVTLSSFHVPSGLLSAFTQYYWRVRVNDYPSNSGVSSFTTGL